MTNVFKQIRPQTIEEFSACIAIGRPDTIQYLEPYKNRKFGLEPITYIHPELEPILGSTYGCIIYQEQILSIVKHFGGFSDGEADVFRKAIGKKIPELVKAQSEKFRTRALEKGYDSDTVQALYDLLVENGSYSFNHGHSIAYALNGYKTAYLKCHYYTLWMAAVLNNTNDDYEKISSTIKFCKDVGIKVTLPDINKSGFDFTPIKETRTILYGLDMIKGVQKDAIEMIMKNRPFSSFDDFMLRCGLVIDKTSTISLIKSGSLDSLSNKSRSVMLLYYFEKRFADGREDIKPIKNVNKNHVKFMVDNGLVDINRVYEKQEYVDILNEYRREMGWMNFTQTYMQGSELDWEMQTVNSFMSGDPFENVWLPDWDTVDIESIGWVGGVITNVTKTKIKKGKNAGAAMAFVNINTRYGVMDCVVFSEKWLKYQDILKFGATVVVCGQKDGDLNMRLTDAITLEKYKATVLTRLNK